MQPSGEQADSADDIVGPEPRMHVRPPSGEKTMPEIGIGIFVVDDDGPAERG